MKNTSASVYLWIETRNVLQMFSLFRTDILSSAYIWTVYVPGI